MESLSKQDRSIVISGSPGTGKSIALVYFLRKRAADRLTTLFTTARTRVTYLFSPDGVASQKTSKLVSQDIPDIDPFPWSLIDTPKSGDRHPPAHAWVGCVNPIQAASPDVESYHDLLESKSGVRWCVQPWTIGEIRKILPLQHLSTSPAKRQALEQNLEGVIEKSGLFDARNIKLALIDQLTPDYALNAAVDNLQEQDLQQIFAKADIASTAVSNCLFGLIRAESHPNSSDKLTVEFLSLCIARRAREKLPLLGFNTAQALIHNFRHAPESGPLGGWVFESLAGGIVCGRGMGKGRLPLVQMKRAAHSTRISYICQIHEPTGSMYVDPSVSDTLAICEREVTRFNDIRPVNIDNGYYVVVVTSTPLFDAFHFDISMERIVINVLQMTTASRRLVPIGGTSGGGSSPGYSTIADLKAKALATKNPDGRSREVSIRYILTVPSQPGGQVI